MILNSFLFDRWPNWQLQRPGLRHRLPNTVQSWVYEPGSLTKRLRKHYGRRFAVEILFQHWQPALLNECRALDLPQHRYALIREVLLHADGKPLILARTVLPAPTIRVAHRNLSHLGTRPLGEVIFSYPHLERRQLDVSQVTPCNWSQPLRQRFDLNETLWGRRTVYAIQRQPLLVSEFFLPDTLQLD